MKQDGALGRTRTGTPRRARILNPLCLPIPPRGHLLNSDVLSVSFKKSTKNKPLT
jgi:hypothetical protein